MIAAPRWLRSYDPKWLRADVAAGVTPSLQVFYDDMHFTDAGAARVAELVLPCVVQALRR